jgi:hypothetical protein
MNEINVMKVTIGFSITKASLEYCHFLLMCQIIFKLSTKKSKLKPEACQINFTGNANIMLFNFNLIFE